ncbi:MAG: nucleotidyltransferase domain-containing protein [Thaumarchaeota archaeon]|nr:nucleotidyltransferase domain-containing protein [Nitrososphaerota archaeon]
MASPGGTGPAVGLSLDPRLSLVRQACPRVGGIESIYAVGSSARGNTGPESDLDVVVVTKFPTYLGRFRKLMSLRRFNIEVYLLGTSLISKVKSGRSSSFIPKLASWRKDGVLVYGKDTLPGLFPRMDKHSLAAYAFGAAESVLWHLGANSNSIVFNDPSYDRRWMLKRARQWSEFEVFPGVPSEWREFGTRLKDQIVADVNPTIMCRLFADMLEQQIHDLRFSSLDQAEYVFLKLLTQRRLLWRTLANKVPIQERYHRAILLLYRSAGGEEAKIFDAVPLLDGQPISSGSKDFGVTWVRMQEAVLEDHKTMMGLGEIRLG